MNGKPGNALHSEVGTGATVSAEVVRGQLQRILASSPFLNSRRASQFLRFVVDRTLAGEDGIKEYLIGIEVFERSQDYDPKDDPVVRIEAGRLRKKLAEFYAGPGSDDPIVIELPKGGYVPVFRERPAGAGPRTVQGETSAEPPGALTDGASGTSSRFWKIAPPVILAALVFIVVAIYYHARQIKPLTEKDTIVVADFANTTGDPVFNDTLKTALAVSLGQSPFLNVLPESSVRRVLKLMTLPTNAKLSPDVTLGLCQRAGSKAYIAGAIASLGSEYVLQLKAVVCGNGATLAEEQATAKTKDKVVETLGVLASRLRVDLGESLSTVQRFDTPLVEATTPSLEALQAFTLGRKAVNEKGEAAALPYHLRAIELDPGFAAAYRAAGADYSGMGQTGRASEYYSKAFQLRDRASGLEKLMITTIYYENVTGELGKAAQTYQEQIQTYPNYPAYTGQGVTYNELGEHEKAAEDYREQIRLRPDSVVGYGNLAFSLLALQHLDEAKKVVSQAQARNLDDFVLREVLYALAFIGGDSSSMAEQQRWFAGKPEENNGLSLESDTEAYVGHLGKARDLTKQAAASAIHSDSKETGAIWLENEALREAAFGNAAAAKQAAAAGLRLDADSMGTSAEAALAFAMLGDAPQAKALAQDLNKQFPLHSEVQSLWLSAINAQLALAEKNPAKAIDDLQIASPADEFALIPFMTNISCLYPTYIRGQAYLAQGDGSAASREFQKIIDHSGIVWNCWTGALAHLGVARANALESRTLQGAQADAARARAMAAYKDFLSRWQDADAAIPIYRAAKAEYGKLSDARGFPRNDF
jgi:tetratricopeptide (TPR) repeat protein